MRCNRPLERMPPHKPLFLLSGLWACLPALIWLRPSVLADTAFWHMHELFFGMASAAIGGYLLTALPHWTGHRTRPEVLWLLVLAWIAGRCALAPQALPIMIVIAAALAYPVLLAIELFGPLVRVGVWRKLWMPALPLGLAASDAILLAAHHANMVPANAPMLLALAFALVVGLLGGRILPAFTQSRITGLGMPLTLQHHRTPGRLAAAAVAFSVLWLATDHTTEVAGWALFLACALQAVRFAGWQSWAIRAQPDILMLHMAWVWLVAGLGLVGVTLAWSLDSWQTACIHALTMGAIGSMIYAIASRAFMPRRAGRLVVTPDLAIGFALTSAATLLRVFLPDCHLFGVEGLHWAALSWTGAWALLVRRILFNWRRPAPFPILSADRRVRAHVVG